jgi:hypothetical protein
MTVIRARPAWQSLGYRARLWRGAHAAWSAAQLVALAEVWMGAIKRREDRRVWGSALFLLLQGLGLVVGRGDCPMGGRQAEWGDPVPFFELVLPPRAAKAAVPTLAFVAIAGLALVVVRRPRMPE